MKNLDELDVVMFFVYEKSTQFGVTYTLDG